MLFNNCCSICLCENKRTINIYKTDLQCAYENLASFEVTEELCFLCNICCTRLRQCHSMFKQAVDLQNTQNRQQAKTVVNLTRHNIENETIPYHVGLAKEETQEFDDQERYFEHEITIKREIETTDWDEDSSCKLENSAVCLTKSKKPRKERANKQIHNDRALCNVCGNTFANKYSLALHNRTHTGEKPYTCDVCQKKFTLLTSLTAHKRTHTGEKPYSCEKCKKKFNTSGYLIKHMRTHTGEKPYTCETCGARFLQKNSLTSHERRHTGEKPYECTACSQKFWDSSGLAKHKRTHLGLKAYNCDVCNKKFSRSDGLAGHKRVHKKNQLC